MFVEDFSNQSASTLRLFCPSIYRLYLEGYLTAKEKKIDSSDVIIDRLQIFCVKIPNTIEYLVYSLVRLSVRLKKIQIWSFRFYHIILWSLLYPLNICSITYFIYFFCIFREPNSSYSYSTAEGTDKNKVKKYVMPDELR